MDKFFAATTVATFAVVNAKGQPVRKFRATKGDMPKYFPLDAKGQPIIGNRVVRELTFKELKAAAGIDDKAARKLRETDYLRTVEPASYNLPAIAA